MAGISFWLFWRSCSVGELLLFGLPHSALSAGVPDGARLGDVGARRVVSLREFLALDMSSGLRLAWVHGEDSGVLDLPAGARVELVPVRFDYWMGVDYIAGLRLAYVNPLVQVKDVFLRTLRILHSLFHPKSDVGIAQLSGPLGIGRLIYSFSTADSYGWLLALSFAVFLNINLAILNLLPIPVLDGGHIVLAFLAKLFGR